MAIQNSYTVNGGAKKTIEAGFVDIDMSAEQGVKAGCKEYPIPLLNKITVTSMEGVFSSSRRIFAGYKIVEQMVGYLVPSGNYNLNTPNLNTIIRSGKFGIFEPAHYSDPLGTWTIFDLEAEDISSLINLGTGIKICVKIEYRLYGSGALIPVYVDIPGVFDSKFIKEYNQEVPFYEQIGTPNSLSQDETESFNNVESPGGRSWYYVTLTKENLNINLDGHIFDPKTDENITVTLMAYIGSTPTADNTFPILPMKPGSPTSVEVPFETYEPTIIIFNADMINNPDNYDDTYGSVADYNSDANVDTTISINITPPDA